MIQMNTTDPKHPISPHPIGPIPQALDCEWKRFCRIPHHRGPETQFSDFSDTPLRSDSIQQENGGRRLLANLIAENLTESADSDLYQIGEGGCEIKPIAALSAEFIFAFGGVRL
jgi:hypothetical protein